MGRSQRVPSMDTGNLLATVIIFTCGWVAALPQGDPRLLSLEGSVRGGAPTACRGQPMKKRLCHAHVMLGKHRAFPVARAGGHLLDGDGGPKPAAHRCSFLLSWAQLYVLARLTLSCLFLPLLHNPRFAIFHVQLRRCVRILGLVFTEDKSVGWPRSLNAIAAIMHRAHHPRYSMASGCVARAPLRIIVAKGTRTLKPGA